MLHFQVLEGPDEGTHLHIRKEIVSIGRSRDNDVCLSDRNVSPYHFCISKHDDKWFLLNLSRQSDKTDINAHLAHDRLFELIEHRGVEIPIPYTVIELGDTRLQIQSLEQDYNLLLPYPDENHPFLKVLYTFFQATFETLASHDRSSAGHSIRVADSTVLLMEAINASQHGRLANYRFDHNTINAGYLGAIFHDIGKLGINTDILNKTGRLFKKDYRILVERCQHFELAELDALTRSYLLAPDSDTNVDIISGRQAIQNRYARYRETIARLLPANEALSRQDRQTLGEMRQIYISSDDKPLLSQRAYDDYHTPFGTLNDKQREAIEVHPVLSYRLLKHLEWPKIGGKVPLIALQHHEKLNGSGYPFRLSEESIAIETRIVTICDIFDALIVDDRGYKIAYSTQLAATKLRHLATEGALDPDFVELFITDVIPRLTPPANTLKETISHAL